MAASFASTERDRARVRDFIQMFVRPHGFDESAALHVVRAVEHEAGTRPEPRQLRPDLRLVKALLSLVAGLGIAPREAAKRTLRGA